MNTQKFSGKELAAAICRQLGPAIDKLKESGLIPHLDIVQVGGDEASTLYASRKIKTAEKLGLTANLHWLKEGSPADLQQLLSTLNNDRTCNGILVEQPLPAAFPKWLDIAPQKDLDGATIASLGALMAGQPGFVPATAAAALAVIQASGVKLPGAKVTIIGRSLVIGKPLALLLCAANATITICHSQSGDLTPYTREADIIVAATGRPGLISASQVKDGVTLIDVGTTPTPEGLKGDFATDAYNKAAFYTPVPGGVGPVTVAIIMRNLVQATAAQNGVII